MNCIMSYCGRETESPVCDFCQDRMEDFKKEDEQ